MELTFELICENLKNGVNFSWSRWGDGEWAALLQTRLGKGNCDGHLYFPDMGARLKAILESQPKYYLGLQRLATEQNADNKEFQRLKDLNQWCNMELLTRASIKGRLQELYEAMKDRNIILVGNDSLKLLPNSAFIFAHILTEINNCWLGYKVTLDDVKRLTTPDTVIIYCASMMSNVLIDDMYKLHGDTITQIDCGSVFDPYVGRMTRSYHHNLKL